MSDRININALNLQIPQSPWFWRNGENGYWWASIVGQNVCLNQGHSNYPDLKQMAIILALGAAEWRRAAQKWAQTPLNDCKNFDSIAEWKSDAAKHADAWQQAFNEWVEEIK